MKHAIVSGIVGGLVGLVILTAAFPWVIGSGWYNSYAEFAYRVMYPRG